MDPGHTMQKVAVSNVRIKNRMGGKERGEDP